MSTATPTIALRPACVAGHFYPAAPAALRAAVGDYLGGAAPAAPAAPSVQALIVPHAGYVYSGPIAASAYARIGAQAGAIRHVALFGPAHRLAFEGLALSRAERFATPLGEVPVNGAALRELARRPGTQWLDAAFDGEHCLEVQLPFLQVLLGDFDLVPVLVGDASPAQVAAALAVLWDSAGTLILISSDLSHYLDHATAQALDARTAAAILALRPDAIGAHQACGQRAIGGLLVEARRRGLHPGELDRRNSGDTAGSRDRVVGYAAYAFC